MKKLRIWSLTLVWSNRTITVTKEYRTKKEAEFWKQLCVDICGKNEHGEKCRLALLKEVEP